MQLRIAVHPRYQRRIAFMNGLPINATKLWIIEPLVHGLPNDLESFLPEPARIGLRGLRSCEFGPRLLRRRGRTVDAQNQDTDQRETREIICESTFHWSDLRR